MLNLLPAAERERDWTVDVARGLAEHESPSTDRAALEACAGAVAARCREAGAAVRREPGREADHVLAEWPGRGRPVLLLGHFDTVWPVGQLARMPVRIAEGRLFGPGVLDMKAGLAVALTAMKVLDAAVPAASRPPVRLLATSDEEVGSRSSRALIERLALDSAAVLVFEPGIPGGALKTARKGVGEFELVVHGVSAHAGADPGAGASAVHELARQIQAIEALADPSLGRSVNVGVIEGGTRSNVVAERARAVVDVRVSRAADAAVIEAALAGLRPSRDRIRLEVTGAVNRPPMERTAGVARLFHLAREVAAGWGEDLCEGETGGASDGNFTAALGVPTLDGLGGVGDGPHALHEHAIIEFLPRRAALAAGILAKAAELRDS